MARLIDSVIAHSGTWERLIELLSRGRLPHALVFNGPSGIGKRKVAWALAQALVCEREERPCGACGACRRVEGQQSESVLAIEPEKGVIKLEAAQNILEFFNLQRIGRARVVIVDSAQLLNPQAGNALLKLIEEPPEHTYFILTVTEISQLLPTLRSRAQVIRFQPLTEAELQRASSEPAQTWMLRSARGSVEQLARFRDSQSEEMRAAVASFLAQAVQGRRESLQEVLEFAKDRNDALAVIHLLQQLLRDWSLSREDERIHTDLAPMFRQLPTLNPERHAELWRHAFQMELDLAAHVDKSLLFENFFYRAQTASR